MDNNSRVAYHRKYKSIKLTKPFVESVVVALWMMYLSRAIIILLRIHD